ncbi:DUF4760 domain-containing protein [Futiania mangrovi]|uniref:DUF4760 domain-containing protein n=1 Tax=Futiania mangrovi TaxID=2959716 RepID=A0A9J6PDI1_9PROT|nr:hypothetical protein [Futiania mangrovii]MCP1336406.1 hypothetical protein [Futiania mangrovii]
MQQAEPLLSYPNIVAIGAGWAQLAVAALAVLAAFIAWRELREIRHAREQSLNIARADFLLELDGRWEAPDMREARELFAQINEEIRGEVAAQALHGNDSARQARMCTAWLERLRKLRTSDAKSYNTLMRLCNFFETVGVMVARGYVSERDLDALLRGPILHVGATFRGHIQEREKETGVVAGLYEHALKLSDRISRLNA